MAPNYELLHRAMLLPPSAPLGRSAETTTRDEAPVIAGRFDLERPAVSRLRSSRRSSSNPSFPLSILLLLSSHTTPSGGTICASSSIPSAESRSFTAASSSEEDSRTFSSADSEQRAAVCDTEASRLHDDGLSVGKGAETEDKVLVSVHGLGSGQSHEILEGTVLFEGISESESFRKIKNHAFVSADS